MKSGASEFGKDHGLLHEVVVAGRKVGWGKDEWARLAHDEKLMYQVRAVMEGRADLFMKDCTIDCGADPIIPDDLTIKQHKRSAVWEWNDCEVDLYLAPRQNSHMVEGHIIKNVVEDLNVLNACVLDFLLTHPYLWPKSWREAVFWGTIYSCSRGREWVRCARKDLVGRWSPLLIPLDSVFGDWNPAAIRIPK